MTDIPFECGFQNSIHVIAWKNELVLPENIHTDQKRCIKGNFFGENIRLIEDVPQENNEEAVVSLTRRKHLIVLNGYGYIKYLKNSTLEKDLYPSIHALPKCENIYYNK